MAPKLVSPAWAPARSAETSPGICRDQASFAPFVQQPAAASEVLVLLDTEVAEILVFFIIEQNRRVVIIVRIIVDIVFLETVRQIIAQTRGILVVVISIVIRDAIRFGVDFRRIVVLDGNNRELPFVINVSIIPSLV